MGIFNKNKSGAVMDVIRCDEPSYLIWKWHPAGSQKGVSRENAIRWNSSLRVKEGSVAVFVYKQKDGVMQDFIEGPFDQMIKTANFPVLSKIVGLLYGGDTPFQAEIYFINLAKIIQIKFGVPFFEVYDPRFLDFGIPVAVRGTLSFQITDYREFAKLHRLEEFSLDEFQNQVQDAIINYIKKFVSNAPSEYNIPVLQIERKIAQITENVEANIANRFKEDFGVTVSGVDIAAIEIDTTSEGYLKLKAVTIDVTEATIQAQTEVNIKNLQDMQRINAENTEETLRIQREEAQYAQRKQTQSSNFAAYQMEQQAAVGIAGANALGQMGASGAGDMNGGGGMNPAAMMAGMAMGGAIGQNMAGMMNGMMSGVGSRQSEVVPPPIPMMAYHVVLDGKSAGPFDVVSLTQMAAAGSITKSSLVWKQGMLDWVSAGEVQELQKIFENVQSLSKNETPPPVPSSL